MAEICSVCCAEQRDESCGDCPHYVTAQRYNARRHAVRPLPGGHFIAEFNPEVEDAVSKALELAQRGKTDRAQSAMEHLLAGNPGNHSVHFGMGVLHLIRGDDSEAITCFDNATAIFPYFMEAHFNKAVAYQNRFDVSNAVRGFRKVVEVGDPKEPEVDQAKHFLEEMAGVIKRTEGVDLDAYMAAQDMFNRAYDLMEQGAWEEALAGFRKAAAKSDRNVPTHGNMGLCLARLGRKAEALRELDRAIEMDPDYEPAKTSRPAVEAMQEGGALAVAEFRSVEFGKEQFLRSHKGKSWLRRLATKFSPWKDR